MGRIKPIVLFWSKIILSVGLGFLLFQRLDGEQVRHAWNRFETAAFVPAVLCLLGSRIAAAGRLRVLLSGQPREWTWYQHLTLQVRSQYYALLVPTGLGGDAYKAFVLKKFSSGSWGRLSRVLLADRLSGLVSLSLVAVLCGYQSFLARTQGAEGFQVLIPGLLILMAILYRLLMRSILGPGISLLQVEGWALGLQLFQLMSAAILLGGLHFHGNWFAALALFLVSSIAAMLPLSYAGLGGRDWVLVSGASWLWLPVEYLLLLGILFFAAQLVTTGLGMGLILWERAKIHEAPAAIRESSSPHRPVG